jgi:hypothetical protein
MPPGIDLLDGFGAARQRGRARQTRRGVVLSAGVAAAAATVAAVTLTIGSAPPALAAVTSALTRTLAQSYHLTERDSSYYIENGQITARAHHTCTSEIDPLRHLAAYTCSNGIGSGREVGGYTYLYIPHPGKHPDSQWIRMRSIVQRPGTSSVTTATPQQMLAEIEKADKVTVVGPASGAGWTGTRYAFSGQPAPNISLNGAVDVDQQGRARALILTIRLTATGVKRVFVMTQALTFSAFGAPVTVTPPPADQTFP